MDNSLKVQVLYPADARKDGDFLSWHSAVLAAARFKGCAAAIPSLEVTTKIISGSLSKAADIVAAHNDELQNLKREDSDDKNKVGESSAAAAARVPDGYITVGTLNNQHDLSALLYQWTDRKKDWAMFNKLDNADPEIGTKMLLLVMRKYMPKGSRPVDEYMDTMRRPQGDDETAEEVWDRIKTLSLIHI